MYVFSGRKTSLSAKKKKIFILDIVGEDLV